jgi:hypothetical protein
MYTDGKLSQSHFNDQLWPTNSSRIFTFAENMRLGQTVTVVACISLPDAYGVPKQCLKWSGIVKDAGPESDELKVVLVALKGVPVKPSEIVPGAAHVRLSANATILNKTGSDALITGRFYTSRHQSNSMVSFTVQPGNPSVTLPIPYDTAELRPGDTASYIVCIKPAHNDSFIPETCNRGDWGFDGLALPSPSAKPSTVANPGPSEPSQNPSSASLEVVDDHADSSASQEPAPDEPDDKPMSASSGSLYTRPPMDDRPPKDKFVPRDCDECGSEIHFLDGRLNIAIENLKRAIGERTSVRLKKLEWESQAAGVRSQVAHYRALIADYDAQAAVKTEMFIINLGFFTALSTLLASTGSIAAWCAAQHIRLWRGYELSKTIEKYFEGYDLGNGIHVPFKDLPRFRDFAKLALEFAEAAADAIEQLGRQYDDEIKAGTDAVNAARRIVDEWYLRREEAYQHCLQTGNLPPGTWHRPPPSYTFDNDGALIGVS